MMNEEELKGVIECSRALDLPNKEAIAVLVKHGWSYENRFDIPACLFVRQLQDKALAA